jgi:hypothetical protein
MAKTSAELRNRALRKLGKLALGATATGAMADDMDDAYNEVYAKLDNLGLVTWASTEDIPDEYCHDVVSLMAYERADGIPTERLAKIQADSLSAILNISAQIAGKWVNPESVSDY